MPLFIVSLCTRTSGVGVFVARCHCDFSRCLQELKAVVGVVETDVVLDPPV
jgi:hypothetical protein